MPAPTRKNLLGSRRRRQDDGEEEESIIGDFADSLSEGSAVSDGDDEAEVEGSEFSDGEHAPAEDTSPAKKDIPLEGVQDVATAPSQEAAPKSNGGFQPSTDTEAMLHGMNQTGQLPQVEEIQFEDLLVGEERVPKAVVSIPKAPRDETPAQRSRREHQEYIRQRNANPAFVPTRGGFFLHDTRTAASNGSNPRSFIRGRGRGYGQPVHPGRGYGFNEATEKPWAHDLHEGHEIPQLPDTLPVKPAVVSQKEQTEKPTPSTAPNRSFSFTSVLGNVTIQIFLPGMEQKKSIPNVVRRQHTLLPQHRPPLRRDKPVRISLPDMTARYIFPSTERSFIFIPRAMRPNQQAYGRGRGRGSFHGSRRPSIYGSAYTPSIAMSRKSSIGASTMRDGIMSPAESVMSRMVGPSYDTTRPIVRMPSGGPTPSTSRTGVPLLNGPASTSQTPAFYGSHSSAIPMHQPRPQKAVSVADIESPASLPYRAPQQQQELPFHQQVPSHIPAPYSDDKAAQQTMPGIAATTPLSQIPEGAVFAQGFQPYPAMGAPTYYGGQYNNGPMFYQPLADNGSYGIPMNGPALAPNFIPGSQSHPIGYLPASGLADGNGTGNMVPHESNGMVYYYNPPMYTSDTQGGLQQFPGATNGNVGMMTNGMPSQPFYYSGVPNGMFYPANTA
ncbi:CASC3/Barentsz eIF4AIII binding-domain-containing protein [Exophiala viscosa]|uniref:CASC3/Barentsz eIF4AIII binding-domain-containing protein n=1 Tax=Exophiala viscosa TaxID=2486360 RepID=UPI0021947F94|nr:CASC3/Barentsz eIF4AIII binding-domain-containing protein [Exophiala viscosa]